MLVDIPLEDKGEINLDDQKVQNLLQIFDQMNLDALGRKELRLVSQRIATKCYENNINYLNVIDLLQTLDLDTEQATEVYEDYHNNCGYLNISNLIKNLKKAGGKRKLDMLENQLNTVLMTANMSSYPTAEINTKEEIALIYSEGKVIKTTYKDQDRTQYLTEEELLDCCPYKLEMTRSFYDETDVTFTWKIHIGNGKDITLERYNLTQSANKIRDMGLSYRINSTQDYLVWCKKALMNYSYTHDDTYIERVLYVPKGFGYNAERKEIVVEDYPLLPKDEIKISEALELVNEYIEDFNSEQEKRFIANNFKWGLISPFCFARKQMVQDDIDIIPYPYLTGTGSTGKSNGHGRFILYMWYENPSDGMVSGKTISTVKQFNEACMISTLPRVFDEGGHRFEGDGKETERDELKDAITKIIVRKTFGKEPKTYISYNSFVITSNGTLYDSTGGLTRRVFHEDFGFKEIKSDEDIKQFNEKYKLSQGGVLNVLRYLAHDFARSVIANPESLRDWRKCVDDYLHEVSKKYNITLHPLLEGWLDPRIMALEDAKNSEEEKLRYAFRRVIMDVKKFNYKDMDDPYEFVKLCVMQQIPELSLVSYNDRTEIQFQKVFLDFLAKRKLIGKSYTYENFASSYDWEYRRDSNHRYLAKEYNEFVAWLFPEFE